MKVVLTFFLVMSCLMGMGQTVGRGVPEKIDREGKYLFYLHGAVVSRYGDNAVNPAARKWGRYEYSNILDSLRQRGFHVISEIRDQRVPDTVYADKIVKQLDTLLKAGVESRHILLIGASAGWNIVLHVAGKLGDKEMHYVMMGGCWPDTYKEYEGLHLSGKFLSIIETSDATISCRRIFEGRPGKDFREVELSTGLSHGFFYKGRSVWIDPIMEWF